MRLAGSDEDANSMARGWSFARRESDMILKWGCNGEERERDGLCQPEGSCCRVATRVRRFPFAAAGGTHTLGNNQVHRERSLARVERAPPPCSSRLDG